MIHEIVKFVEYLEEKSPEIFSERNSKVVRLDD